MADVVDQASSPLPPVVDIVIGAAAASSSVHVNGVDITRALSGVSISCMAGELTQITLLVRPGHARATVQGALESVLVLDEPATAHASDPHAWPESFC